MNFEKPWGKIEGVRPVKHVLRMRGEGYSDEEIRQSLKNEYTVVSTG